MFHQLLELLLHAKSGVFAGIFLIGATGALVTATVENGVTTITITQASPSPSASASPTASPSGSPSASPSASPSSSPSASPSPSPSATGSAEPKCEQVLAVQDVNRAFSALHTDLAKSRRDHKDGDGRATLKDADTELKQIRQAAVKAIHATGSCGDEDEDTSDENTTENDEDADDSDEHGGDQSTLVFEATDPAGIADEAIAMMQLVHDEALATFEETTTTESPTASPSTNDRRGGSDRNKSGDHGKKSGHGGSDSEDDSD